MMIGRLAALCATVAVCAWLPALFLPSGGQELSAEETASIIGGACCGTGQPRQTMRCTWTTVLCYIYEESCAGYCQKCDGDNWTHTCQGEAGQCNTEGTQDCGTFWYATCADTHPDCSNCNEYENLGPCVADNEASSGC